MPTLIDGREVSNSSDEWRAECEARCVAAMDAYEAVEYIELVAKHRGRDAAGALHSFSFDVANAIERAAQQVAQLPT